MKQALLFFVKFPIAGCVKSRLGDDIGYELAARYYSAFVLDLLARIDRHEIETYIFFDPNHSVDIYERWLGNRKMIPQHGKDLGERMFNAFEDAFKLGYDSCVLIGSDLPDLTAQEINRGMDSLREHPACVGPAKDGGYFLIGFQKEALTKVPFTNMEWSTPKVFTETITKIKSVGLEGFILQEHADIDTAQDLVQLMKHKDIQTECPHTLAVSIKE
ncbi:TIGR04282 family arsenosugar biosynthesis glycosyltransferase [Maridesulfovibrio frigidus]|uniref:TIGR04282 family arsenosugar biosynthesis glycosyltransferase n=1 Tax=Maridesulfovibrio frigidus TaxID=340956 RepID=UPI00068F7266|nr:TIGR04282 family arsenosugar biosynthesis glycosyltransferase [Maridesulfovibrio frigidus]